MTCTHPTRQFYRVCGQNSRPGQPWVPRAEVPVPIDTLPLLSETPKAQQGNPGQQSLFGD